MKLQTDNLKFELFAQKNLNITLFCKEIQTHLLQVFTWRVKKKSTKRKNVNSCCLHCGKGEYPEREVVWIVEVTTRWRERSPRAHLLCLNREKDPQPENLGTLKLSSSSSSLVGSPSHW